MTKTSAVICEFNPIHYGHKFILSKARENVGDNGCVIAVMSGNFTQRCTPAVFDKYTRAESALRCGADIVLELPFPWCSSGVEDFALGGVYIASKLGAESLTFGSESGDSKFIESCADVKSSPEFVERLRILEKNERDSGSAVLFARAMAEFGLDADTGANDKLGMEYMICGRKYGIGSYNAILRDMNCKSAKNIRETIFSGGIGSVKSDIPCEVYDIFEKSKFCDEKRYNDILFMYSRMLEKCRSSEMTYAKNIAEKCASADEFIRELPQKKLTLARMRREILFSLLGIEELNKKSPPQFTVLLGANKCGREYIGSVKKKLEINVITKPADVPSDEVSAKQYEIHCKADKLYTLCTGQRADSFIRSRPVII